MENADIKQLDAASPVNVVTMMLQVFVTIGITLILHIVVRIGFVIAAMVTAFFVWLFVAAMFVRHQNKQTAQEV